MDSIAIANERAKARVRELEERLEDAERPLEELRVERGLPENFSGDEIKSAVSQIIEGLEDEVERLRAELKTAEEFENAVTWPIRRSFVELGEVTAGIPTWKQMVDAARSIVQRVKQLEEENERQDKLLLEWANKWQESQARIEAALAKANPNRYPHWRDPADLVQLVDQIRDALKGEGER